LWQPADERRRWGWPGSLTADPGLGKLHAM
jgi:hypothetical protein